MKSYIFSEYHSHTYPQYPLIIISTTECPVLDDPANGMVTWTSLTTGGIVTYVCDPGFELVGDEMRDCQSNSEWSGEAPICRCKFILVSLTIQSVYRTECAYADCLYIQNVIMPGTMIVKMCMRGRPVANHISSYVARVHS